MLAARCTQPAPSGRCGFSGLGSYDRSQPFHDIRAPHSYRLTRAETQTPPSQVAWLVIHPDLKGAPATRVVSDPILSIFAPDAEGRGSAV